MSALAQIVFEPCTPHKYISSVGTKQPTLPWLELLCRNLVLSAVFPSILHQIHPKQRFKKWKGCCSRKLCRSKWGSIVVKAAGCWNSPDVLYTPIMVSISSTFTHYSKPPDQLRYLFFHTSGNLGSIDLTIIVSVTFLRNPSMCSKDSLRRAKPSSFA